MLAIDEGSWLLTRGHESVRMSRHRDEEDAFVLVVHGPGTSLQICWCPDILACIEQQQQIELRLLAEGYALNHYAPERRRNPAQTRLAGERRDLRLAHSRDGGQF